MSKPIYVFNGKDITNLFCFQVRDVARIIAGKELVTFPIAVGMFAASDTYKTMREVENTLWAENADLSPTDTMKKWSPNQKKRKLYLTYPKSQTLSDQLTWSSPSSFNLKTTTQLGANA